jgi:hypothetical protein
VGRRARTSASPLSGRDAAPRGRTTYVNQSSRSSDRRCCCPNRDSAETRAAVTQHRSRYRGVQAAGHGFGSPVLTARRQVVAKHLEQPDRELADKPALRRRCNWTTRLTALAASLRCTCLTVAVILRCCACAWRASCTAAIRHTYWDPGRARRWRMSWKERASATPRHPERDNGNSAHRDQGEQKREQRHRLMCRDQPQHRTGARRTVTVHVRMSELLTQHGQVRVHEKEACARSTNASQKPDWSWASDHSGK